MSAWVYIFIVLAGYFAIQLLFNLAKLGVRGQKRVQHSIAFASAVTSNIYLVAASLVVAVIAGLDFRVEIPRLFPDLPLILVGILALFLTLLSDLYIRLVLRRRLGQQLLMDAEETFLLLPVSVATWEMAFFNFLVLKPFGYELFIRGLSIAALLPVFKDWPWQSQFAAVIVLSAVVELLLKPDGQRVVSAAIVSVTLSIIFLASSGIVITLLIRVLASALISLYLLHLAMRVAGAGKDEVEQSRDE